MKQIVKSGSRPRIAVSFTNTIINLNVSEMRVLFQSVKKAGMIWVSEPIGLSI